MRIGRAANVTSSGGVVAVQCTASLPTLPLLYTLDSRGPFPAPDVTVPAFVTVTFAIVS